MATAAASLSGCSMAAWPPRLKRPARYPVRPRLRVGMASGVAGFEGSGGSADAVRLSRPPATSPAVATPVCFRKLRREEAGFLESSFMAHPLPDFRRSNQRLVSLTIRQISNGASAPGNQRETDSAFAGTPARFQAARCRRHVVHETSPGADFGWDGRKSWRLHVSGAGAHIPSCAEHTGNVANPTVSEVQPHALAHAK